jgi:hypothetical protein
MFLVKTEHDLIGDIVDPFVQGLLPCGAQCRRAARAAWHRVTVRIDKNSFCAGTPPERNFS